MTTSTKQQPSPDPAATVLVPLDAITLVTDKAHPLYDKRAEEKVLPAFVEDLGNNGLLNAIILVREEDGKLLIAAGRRRFLAAQKLGWTEIAARIIDAPTALVQQEVMIRENEQRKNDSLVRKAWKLKAYWKEMEAAYLEQFEEGAEIVPLGEKEKLQAASAIFGVGQRQIKNYALLAYNTSPKVLAAAEKGAISDSIAIEIAVRNPDNFEKQEKHLISLLAHDKGRGKRDFTNPIGERPIKAKELIELARERADIPSKFKVPMKDFALFLSGKMKEEERQRFIASNEGVQIWLEADPLTDESPDDDYDSNDE